MFRRALLLLFSILVTLAFFANSYAGSPAEPPVVLPAQPLTVFPAIVTVIKSANVRAGPGTDFPVISGARPGQRLTVYGCNFDCSWYQLADDCWIAAFLVKPEQPAVPVSVSVSVSVPITVAVVVPPVVVPVVTAAVPLPTSDPRLPTVVVSIPITLTEGMIQTTQCPQTIADVNTYAGPGLTFAVVEAIPAGECVAVVARNTLGDWVQLSHGMWMLSAAILYGEPVEFLPVLDQIFTPTPVMPPTPIAAPGLSAEEQDYLSFINSQLQVYSSARDTLTQQYTLLAEDPTLLTNDDWRSLISATTRLIRVVNENMRARVPPPRFATAHAEFINAANHYELASNLIDDALETFDVALLATAEASAIEGDAALQRANILIEEAKLQPVLGQVVVATTATPIPGVQSAKPMSVPILSSEEQDYLNFISSMIEAYALAWNELGNLLISVGQNPTLMSTDDWILKTATAIALIQVTNEDIRTRTSPPRFMAAHAELVNAANHFDQAMSLLTEGIDNVDANKIVAAQSSMIEGNSAAQRAASIIEAVRLQPASSEAVSAATATAVSDSQQPTPTPTPLTLNNSTSSGNSQPFTCTGGCATAPNPSCNIKGNADSKIYHTPSSQYYDRTDVDPADGDVWFCTEDEARAAGYRPPEN